VIFAPKVKVHHHKNNNNKEMQEKVF